MLAKPPDGRWEKHLLIGERTASVVALGLPDDDKGNALAETVGQSRQQLLQSSPMADQDVAHHGGPP